jgi:MFS family permease
VQTYLSLLQRRSQFRYVWLAEVISLFGDWFNTIATVMIVNRYAPSGLAVSGLFLARSLPPFFAGPIAGVVADRFNRKTVLIASDLLRALIVLGFLLVNSAERLWLVYVLSMAQFVVSAFFEPARSAIVPDLVEKDELIAANTLSSVTWSAMLALGAAVGGLVAAGFGVQIALSIDALSFLASAALIGRSVVRPRAALSAPTSGWRDFVDGLAYVRARPDIGLIATIKGFGQIGSMDVIAAVLAERTFPLGQEGGGAFGLMLAAVGVGTVLGPLVGNRFHDNTAAKLQRAITGGYILIVIGWWVVGVSPSLPLVLLGFLLRGMGGSLNWTYSDILIQLKVPSHFLGRVFALNLAFFTLMLSISVWTSGYLMDHFQVDPRQLAFGLGLASVLPLAMWAWATRSATAIPVGEVH